MKKFISYVPQENFSSPMLTGRENLMHFARLMGYSKDEAKELVSEEFLREKSVLFWTIVRPIIWVLIGSFTFVSEVKKEVIPYIGRLYHHFYDDFCINFSGHGKSTW